MSSFQLQVGNSSSCSSRPGVCRSFKSRSMSTRDGESGLGSSSSSSRELSGTPTVNDSMLWRMCDQNLRTRAAPAGAATTNCTYATAGSVSHAGVNTAVAAVAAAEAADENSDLPSADELTLSGDDDFSPASRQSHSNSVSNRHLGSELWSKDSSSRFSGGSSSSCGSRRGSESQSGKGYSNANSSTCGTSSSFDTRRAMTNSDTNTINKSSSDKLWTNCATRSSICCDRSWRGEGVNSDSATEDAAASHAFERLWKASASSFSCGLSTGSVCSQLATSERTLLAAATVSQETPCASFDRTSFEGTTRSSRSSTAQSSVSTVSNVSSATCSTAGSSVGSICHAKGGYVFSPKASFCSSASLSSSSPSSCGLAEGANEEGEGAARPPAAPFETRVAEALCDDAESGVAEAADQQHGCSRGHSGLTADPAALFSPSHDGDEAYSYDESADTQLSPDFLLSTTPSEEQLLQHSSCPRSGGDFLSRDVGGRSSCNYFGGSDPLRERERREARERQTLLLARQIVARFRAVHGTSATADAVQLLQRYFHASRRHLRDTRSLERLAAACCYISARQKGGDSTSLFCLNDLAAGLQPLPSNRRRTRGSVAAQEQQEAKLQHQGGQETREVDHRQRRSEEQLLPEEQRQQVGESQGRHRELQRSGQQEANSVQQETPRELVEPCQSQHDWRRWRESAQERQRAVQMAVRSSTSQSDGEASAGPVLATVSSYSAGELPVGSPSSPAASSSSEVPTYQAESVMSGTVNPAGKSAFSTELPSFDVTAVAGGAASAGAGDSWHTGAATAKEVLQQSSKSQYAGHARCRTLARWIARVCRRLQLQQLPSAEPDMFLRCNALLRRVRQLVEQRLEEQEEKTEERRAALRLVQQELQQQQQQQLERGEHPQPELRGQQRRQRLDKGCFAEEAGTEETSAGRGRQWGTGGADKNAKPLTTQDGDWSHRDEVGRKQAEELETSVEGEDVDLILLRSVLAGEAGEFLPVEKPHRTGKQQPGSRVHNARRCSGVETDAALLPTNSGDASGAGTRAGARHAVEKKQRQHAQDKQCNCLAERAGEREREQVIEFKRRHSTMSWQGEQQKSKRSREEDEVCGLSSFEVSSEVRQRSTATNSGRPDSPRGERGYNLYVGSSEGVGASSSNDEEPTTAATSAGNALLRMADRGSHAVRLSGRTSEEQLSAPLHECNREIWVTDTFFSRAAPCSGKSWGDTAAGAAEERSSSGRMCGISESSALMEAATRKTGAAPAEKSAATEGTSGGDTFVGQREGNPQLHANALPGGGASTCFDSPVASARPLSASSHEGRHACDGRARREGRIPVASEFAAAASSATANVEVTRPAGVADKAWAGVSPASASLRSTNTPCIVTQRSSCENLERVLETSSRGRGVGGGGYDSELLSLLAALGKSWDSTPVATPASADDGRDSSGEEGSSGAAKETCFPKVTHDGSSTAALGAAGSSPSPQYVQRVLHLHMKKSAWQQRCHLRALEKLKREREKVFRGLVLMYRVLTAVYNRSTSSAGSRSSHANSSCGAATSRTAAPAAGARGGRADEPLWCGGRSEDPLDSVWRARGRSDAVCMASLIILVFQWVQVVVPQRVVIDALHVDRKSVYTRRMEHMRILRALFRRLKKQDSVSVGDDEEDLAARFCEVLDSPALSRQLLEVAEEGLCSSDLVLVLRRDAVPSLCAPALPPQQQQQLEQQKEKEQHQEPTQRQHVDQRQERRSWCSSEHQIDPAGALPQCVEKGASQKGDGCTDATSFHAVTKCRPRKEGDEALRRAASFAAVARAAVAAAAGEGAQAPAGVTRSSSVTSCAGGHCMYWDSRMHTQASHTRNGEEFLTTKRARRDCYSSQRGGAAVAANATASAAQFEGDLSADDGKIASACRSCGGNDEGELTLGRTAAAGLQVKEMGGAQLQGEDEHRSTGATASHSDWVPSVCCSAVDDKPHARSTGQAATATNSFTSLCSSRKTPATAGSVGLKDGAETARCSVTGGAGISGMRDATDGGDAAGDAGNPSGTTEGERSTTKGRRAKTRSRGSQPQALPSTEQLKLAKTAVLQSLPPAADVVSLQFERTQQRWVCKWLQSSGEGRAAGWKRRCFSVLKYGYDGAHLLAAAAATKLRDGRQKLQQQQQQQGKSVSAKCRRSLPASAAARATSPIPIRRT